MQYKMKDNNSLKKLEEALKELSFYEKQGFDTSSLKIFIKGFKEYLKITSQNDNLAEEPENNSFENKLLVIQRFLEDRKAFLTIKDVIDFANSNLNLGFLDQKESRDTTISRIISRIRSKPELKDTLKSAVFSLKNEKSKGTKSKTKKEIISAETFGKWAEIIKNI